ncbi:uncharacterized protein LOC122668447 [Telopea speciosissima]|uniref:uncharacterized protein LOC122668447 n=1 Tax=Telopea speciosissima TaxID=54955 RepID=UPI001CC3F725|nr:uncharacterized protein LOC122668447 [Telopea speciosissima]
MGKKDSRSLITLCSFICWYLWLSRNDLVFGCKIWQPCDVISAVVNVFQEFASVHSVTVLSPPSTSSILQRWIAPTVDSVRCNCDASLSLDSCKSGIDFICRSHSGLPLFAVLDPVSFSDILVGEAIAVRKAMLEMIANGYVRVMVESDNSNLVIYIRDGGRTSPLMIRVIIEDIIQLSSFFVSCSFTFPREINSMADSLARRALSLTCVTN